MGVSLHVVNYNKPLIFTRLLIPYGFNVLTSYDLKNICIIVKQKIDIKINAKKKKTYNVAERENLFSKLLNNSIAYIYFSLQKKNAVKKKYYYKKKKILLASFSLMEAALGAP